jgi:hypothetical protein
MASGTFTEYNKIRPGSYTRFISKPRPLVTIGERGTVIVPLELPYGDEENFIEVFGSDLFDGRAFAKIGMSATDFHINKKVIIAVGDCQRLLIMRKNRGGSRAMAGVKDLTATAQYTGIGGNKISFSISGIIGTDLFNVITLWDNLTVDKQEVKNLGELEDNAHIKWTHSSNDDTLLTDYITASITLNGGTNGTITDTTLFADFFAKAKFEKWESMALDTEDPQIITQGIQYIKRLADEEGVYGRLVVPNINNLGEADYERVVSVEQNLKRISTGEQLSLSDVALKVASMRAGVRLEDNIANEVLQDYEVVQMYDNAQVISALKRGLIAFTNNFEGKCKIERDINTFKMFTPLKNEEYSYNQSMDLFDTVIRTLNTAWERSYQNKILNNYTNRQLWRAEIDTVFRSFSSRGLIVDYAGVEDIAVLGLDDFKNPNWINKLSDRLKDAIFQTQIDITGIGLTKSSVVVITIINNVVNMEILYTTVITE